MFSWSVPSAFGVTSSPPESGGVPVWAGWSERALFIPLPRLLSLSAYKITTFLQLTSSQFILTHPNSSIIIQTNPNLTQIFTEITEILRPSDSSISHRNHRNHRNFSSFGLFNLTQKSQKSQKYSSSGLYYLTQISQISQIFYRPPDFLIVPQSRWSSESRTMSYMGYAESRQRKTKVK